jgi:hypothetical protein
VLCLVANAKCGLTTRARIFDDLAMTLRSLAVLLVCFLFSPRLLSAEELEKIRAVSPDKKFAMRITCDSEPEDPKNIDASLVKALEIVSLPKKEVVGTLEAEAYDGFRLIWASDSKWSAFYSMSGARVGDTSVYHFQGDKFAHLETGEMSVPTKGEPRNQYIEPVRWLKPGTLVLKQFTIFRGDAGDSTIELTVRFDESGKFHVISKRNSR